MSVPPPAIRVLVCEDQALVRAGFVTIFSAQADMEVVGEAADGREGVRSAQELEPDVVVMDIRMPLLDGIEATRHLAYPDSPSPAKILIVTTFNVDEYVYEALRAGCQRLHPEGRPAARTGQRRTHGRPRRVPAGPRRHPYPDRPLRRTRTPLRRAAVAGTRAPEGPHPREHEVLLLISEGLSNAEIAAELVLSPETVKTYVSRILTKLDLRDRVQAVVLAYRAGLVGGGD